MHESIDLSKAGRGNIKRTRSRPVEALWMIVEFLLISNPLRVSSTLRARDCGSSEQASAPTS
jgi:hypothetical protein